jgi:hypothetical protein
MAIWSRRARDDVALLRKELLAAREAGIVNAEWLEASRSPADDQPALRFPRQARVHPLKISRPDRCAPAPGAPASTT